MFTTTLNPKLPLNEPSPLLLKFALDHNLFLERADSDTGGNQWSVTGSAGSISCYGDNEQLIVTQHENADGTFTFDPSDREMSVIAIHEIQGSK